MICSLQKYQCKVILYSDKSEPSFPTTATIGTVCCTKPGVQTSKYRIQNPRNPEGGEAPKGHMCPHQGLTNHNGKKTWLRTFQDPASALGTFK